MTTVGPYKVVILGCSGCGKSAYLSRLRTGEYVSRYEPTRTPTVHPLEFATNHGPVQFDVWEQISDVDEMPDAFYEGVNGVLVMGSVESPNTLTSVAVRAVNSWVNLARDKCGNVPLVIVMPRLHESRLVIIPDAVYVSTKQNLYLDLPFHRLAQQLSGDYRLTFDSRPA